MLSIPSPTIAAAASALILLLTGCTDGSTEREESPEAAPTTGPGAQTPSPTSPPPAETPPTASALWQDNPDLRPVPGDDRINPGDQFLARPNFDRFVSGCRTNPEPGCRLPLFASPRQIPGSAVNLGDFPHEEFKAPEGEGDFVKVICQVEALEPNDPPQFSTVSDDRGPAYASNIWNKVVIPADKVAGEAIRLLEPAPDGNGYYAYGPDIWLGDSSRLPDGRASLEVHDIECREGARGSR